MPVEVGAVIGLADRLRQRRFIEDDPRRSSSPQCICITTLTVESGFWVIR
jgi:hypothetical protein